MKTILMILLLSLPLLSNESEIQEPVHSLYQMKVLKNSNAIIEFEEIESIKDFMIRNNLRKVWIKSPESGRWKVLKRIPQCSCEVHSSVL